jgi:transposase-like protein
LTPQTFFCIVLSMKNETPEPKTLQQAIVFFSHPENCVNYLVERRWPEGVTCPTCGSANVVFQPKRRLFQCKECRPKGQFSVKVGTIMEDSAIGLDKWLCAMWMLANCKNGVSSWEIHRSIGVTQKTAWFMLQRLRLALQGDKGGKLSGNVEVDETFIGGIARNMHKNRRHRISRNGILGKVAVMGLLERHGGEVRTVVLDGLTQGHLQPKVREHVEQDSHVYSDAHAGYTGLNDDYFHMVINHAEEYVNGNIHTNGIENYWSLLKRTVKGTYVSIEPFHLFRYLDEQAFRFNNRKQSDAYRFDLAVSRIVGKRLTYRDLTGKTDADDKLSSH